MGTKRPLSYSQLKTLRGCPTHGLYNTFLKKGSATFDGISPGFVPNAMSQAYTRGSLIHKVLEDSMNSLKDYKAKLYPGDHTVDNSKIGSDVRRMLESVSSAAEQRLDGVGYGDTYKSYVKGVINSIGNKYLKDPTAQLYAEHDFQTQLSKGISPIRGQIDLMLSYQRQGKNILDIYDYKSSATESEVARLLETTDATDIATSDMALQRAIYMTHGFENGNIPADEVHFRYLMNQEGTVKAVGRASADRQMGAEIKKSLMVEIAKENASRSMAYDRLISGGERGFKKHMMETLQNQSVMCSPHQCAHCPMRYHCKNYFLLEAQRVDREMGIKGIPSSRMKRSTRSLLREFLDEVQGEDRTRWTGTSDDALSYYKSFGSKHINDSLKRDVWEQFSIKGETELTTERVQAILDSSSTDQKAREYLARVTERLPFDLLDDDIHPQWMGDRFRRGIRHFMRQRIEEVAGALDTRSDILTDHVMESIGTNARFADILQTEMLGRAAQYAREHNLKLGPGTLEKIVKRYEHTVDQSYMALFANQTDHAVISEILQMDREAITSILPDAEKMKVPEIRKALLDTGRIPSLDLDGAMARVANADTSAGVLERTRLSDRRFPVGTMAATLFLTYLSGANVITNIRESKLAKMAQYTRNQKEKEVDDGTHASPHSIIRRLLLSDFGSKYRPFTGVSPKMAAVLTSVSSRMRSALKYVTSSARIERDIQNVEIAQNLDIRRGFASALENPMVLMSMAGAASFLVSGYANWHESDRSIGQKAERRKRRLKRFQESYRGSDSQWTEQKSDLRRAYGMPGPFGSPILMGMLRNMSTFKPTIGIGLEQIASHISRIFGSGRSYLEGVSSSLRSVLSASKFVKGDVLGDYFSAESAMTRGLRTASQEFRIADTNVSTVQAASRRALQTTEGVDLVKQEVIKLERDSVMRKALRSVKGSEDMVVTAGGMTHITPSSLFVSPPARRNTILVTDHQGSGASSGPKEYPINQMALRGARDMDLSIMDDNLRFMRSEKRRPLPRILRKLIPMKHTDDIGLAIDAASPKAYTVSPVVMSMSKGTDIVHHRYVHQKQDHHPVVSGVVRDKQPNIQYVPEDIPKTVQRGLSMRSVELNRSLLVNPRARAYGKTYDYGNITGLDRRFAF